MEESVVTDYVEISEELLDYERELAPMKKGRSSIPVEQLNSARARLDQNITQCNEDLASLRSNHGDGIISLAARREELRASARNLIRVVGALDPKNSDRNAVTEMVVRAVTDGVLSTSGSLYVASVEDPILQEAEARVADFLEAVKAVREEHRQEETKLVSEFLLSDRTPTGGGDSPLQAEKRKTGKVSLTRLRAGEGKRAFVPVHGSKKNEAGEPTGEEYFMGEVAVEMIDGEPTFTRATRVALCKKIFFTYDPREERTEQRGTFVLPTDLETLHPRFLRTAIERQLAKDGEAADRREKANLLAAVGNYPDAVIFDQFRYSDKPGRWIVHGTWTPEGREWESRVDYHVVSDGKRFHIADAACDLKEVDETFFGMYMEPTELSALSMDKRWLAQAATNREFEIGWVLRKEASKHTEVTFLDEDNVANAFGLNGVDGVYAGMFRWDQNRSLRDKTDAPKWTYGGCIVERRGSKIHCPYATPGVAERLLEKEQEVYEIADLPKWTRAVSKAIWVGATRDGKTIPEHLKPATRTTE